MALAALPVLPTWLWNTGHQVLPVSADPANSMALAWQAGLTRFLPLLLGCLLAVALVESLFAMLRRRPVEPGWYLPAWLFALLLPGSAPLAQAAVALGLGVLIGRLVFGGAGKYFASPALVGALILISGYPAAFANSPFAVNSALACLPGALYLAFSGTVSWRILLGGVSGVFAVTGVLAVAGFTTGMPWYGPLATGAFAFGLVFLAGEPGSTPLTPGGRWFLGLAAGILTVLTATFDPAHPDASLHAILLAALFAPLADYLAVRRAMARRRRRAEAWP